MAGLGEETGLKVKITSILKKILNKKVDVNKSRAFDIHICILLCKYVKLMKLNFVVYVKTSIFLIH